MLGGAVLGDVTLVERGDLTRERGDWGAAAASEAVTRTITAILANAVIAAFVLPRA